MKTFFLVLFCSLASFAVGGLGGSYYFQHEFTRVTSLNWDEFNQYSAQCEANAGEPCGIYGDFAPKSKIQIQGQ